MIKKLLVGIGSLLLCTGLAAANMKTPAKDITVDTASFNKNLGPADDSVQKALQTIDQAATGGGSPGGSNGQAQYNNNGVFSGGNMNFIGGATGNVGINSTTPSAQLDVNGGIRTKGFNLSAGTSLSGKVLTSDASGNGTWQSTASGSGTVNPGFQGHFPFYDQDGPAVSDQSVLSTDGTNIGIGSAAPGQLLDVQGTIRSNSFVGPGIISGLSTGKIPKASSATGLTDSVISESNGNIGIGSSTPGMALDVQGTLRASSIKLGTASGLVKLSSGTFGNAVSGTDYAPATSGSSLLMGNGSGGFANATAGTDYEKPLTFSTGLTRTVDTVTLDNSQSIVQLNNLTTNGFVTTSGGNGTLGIDGVLHDISGNIGIGTTKPGSFFALGATSSGGSATKNLFNINSSGNITVLGGTNANINSVTVDLSNGGSDVTMGNNSGVANGGVNIHSTATSGGYVKFSPGDVEKMRITSGGNLGIGTSIPAATIDALGNVRGYGFHSNSDLGGITAAAGIDLDPNGAGSLVHISPARNVGIATINPEERLTVFGNVKATAFIGDGSRLTGLGGWTVGVNTLSTTSNVGIGTLAPQKSLHIYSTNTTTSPAIRIESAAASGRAYDILSTTTSSPLGAGKLAIVDKTSGLPRLVLDSNGNVGIGTFSPLNGLGVASGVVIGASNAGLHAAPSNGLLVQGNVGIGSVTPGKALDVQGTVRASFFSGDGSALTNVPSTGTTAGGANAVQYSNGSNTAGAEAAFSFNGTNVGIGTSNATNASLVLVKSSTTKILNASSSSGANGDYFTVDNAGNVGIGSVSPVAKMIVNATSGNIIQATNASTTEFSVTSAGNGTFNGNLVTGGTGQSTLSTGLVVNSGTNSTANNGDFTVKTNVGIGTFYILASSGNVGIGSPTPVQALDVSGVVRATGFSTNVGIGTAGSGATSCLCKQYSGGICIVLGTCT